MRRVSALLTIAAAFLLAGCGGSSSSSDSSSSASAPSTTTTAAASTQTSTATALGFEGIPIERGPSIAPASTTGTARVDGINCGPTEELIYHIHAHLSVYDNGTPRALPGGIGIPGSRVLVYPGYGPVATGGRCIYWLHTHAPDGVIHIESPTQRIYTLGDFFDEWRQPLSGSQVGAVAGKVTAILNGRLWTTSPRAIPLLPHAGIQLDVGSTMVPFQPVSWAGTQL